MCPSALLTVTAKAGRELAADDLEEQEGVILTLGTSVCAPATAPRTTLQSSMERSNSRRMRRVPLARPLEGLALRIVVTGRPTLRQSRCSSSPLMMKVGLPVSLNAQRRPSNGQANGARLIRRGTGRSVLDCEVISGAHAGAHTNLPRVNVTPSYNSLPSKFIRHQCACGRPLR
jgi:hypothetical protein